MHSRFLVPLFCVAALAFACGPRPHSGDATATATAATTAGAPPAHRSSRGNKGPVIASSLDVRVKDGVAFAFHVTNSSDRTLELSFPSGQTHDFAVVDSAGRTIWRWSDGRMFTQALRNKVLDSGETTTFDGRWDAAGRRGTFTAVATLKSENHPVETRVEFTLP